MGMGTLLISQQFNRLTVSGIYDLTDLNKIEKTIYNAAHDISQYKQLYVNFSFCY